MTKKSEVIIIEADIKPELPDWAERHIRVASYCRVSTDNDEQLTSFESQKEYYTAKIMGNRHWIMAGIFADDGISATSSKKRPEFQKMLRKCKQGKIDLILTKSVSRFARNTLDCIGITRQLRELGVAVYFEKENINTLEMESEFVLTIMGSLAQAESESISKNVAMGKRQAMQSGKVNFQYSRIYGYERGEDDQPHIIREQAEVIRRIFNWYLSGASVIDIAQRLNEEMTPTPTGKSNWTDAAIRGLLKNEKYCGDVLQQKTFVADVISKRVIKNEGQLPKYLIRNYHEPIVSREIFYKVQTEVAKRKTKPAIKKAANNGFSKYSGKYGLNEIMICAECGSAYRHRIWTKRSGKKVPVWRCINRLQNGARYCKASPTLQEYALQDAILRAIKENFKPEDWQTADHLPVTLVNREWVHGDIKALQVLKQRLMSFLEQSDVGHTMDEIEQEIARLQVTARNSTFEAEMQLDNAQTAAPLVWDEMLVRNLISKVIVSNGNSIQIRFKNGKQANAVVGE